MSDYSKNRVLALYKILLKYSDEKHMISMQDILSYMEVGGYPCSEDSILRYIKQLRTVLDVDVISTRGRNAKYFIGARLLEKEELKLIVDSINASNFIEETIAVKMIGKLKETMSVYDAEELDRNVLGINIAKAENKKILYNVNIIQEALVEGVQISFNNLVWNKNKRLEKKNARKNTLNPWALIWANDRYYLYGYDLKEKDGKLGERHYRVDKLTDIELMDIPREGKNQFRRFDANTYLVTTNMKQRKGSPNPLLIEKKCGDVSMVHIIKQILYLTQLHVGSTQKMRLPITTGYADKICKNREFVPEGKVDNKLFFL